MAAAKGFGSRKAGNPPRVRAWTKNLIIRLDPEAIPDSLDPEMKIQGVWMEDEMLAIGQALKQGRFKVLVEDIAPTVTEL